ncbi:MAG: glucosaminidase domain-containing protein [Candidatus Gribaldobacteria bacterium]|nr:glucosaminidase domain-containing protein [Candidatus Gribaldobacteria bacterium]
MNIEYLIQLLENRVSALTSAKDQAFSSGDLERINLIDVEIFGVQDTLTKLRLLFSVSQETTVTNNTLLEAMKVKSNIIVDGSTLCFNDYDISTYAVDPLHERKIADILLAMGSINSAEEINVYIESKAIGSPLKGQMVFSAMQKYNVDTRLAMAIMELESRFGTAGVAVDTLNPGNVGNTGESIRRYGSWEEGVEAVAVWLNAHRRNIVASEPVEILNIDNSTIAEIASTSTVPEIPIINAENSTTTDITAIPTTDTATSSDKTGE